MSRSAAVSLPKLLTPGEAAKLLNLAVGTLAQWRFHNRYGLPYVKAGHFVRYKESDVLNFIERQTQKAGAR